MGIFTDAKLLDWEEIKPQLPNLRIQLTQDFIKLFQYIKLPDLEVEDDVQFRFGEEIEYSLVSLLTEQREAQVYSQADVVLPKLASISSPKSQTQWHPEYANWMIEGVSKRPYQNLRNALDGLFKNLQSRRQTLQRILPTHTYSVTLPMLPMIGLETTTTANMNPYSKSQQIADSEIYPNCRYLKLTRNIRQRRASRVSAYLSSANDGLPNVCLDCMAYGMGSSCTQITFDAQNLDESAAMYDIMVVLSPVLLAASAGCPIYRGRLVNTDTRWSALSQLVDDRTTSEIFRGVRSRYSSNYGYLGSSCDLYQDQPYPFDFESYQTLCESGVPKPLARYVANLIHKDPLLVQDQDQDSTEPPGSMFVSHQSSVWQNVRWKALLKNGKLNYRVEFRPLDVLVTDRENTAFCIFLLIYVQACLRYQKDIRIPISQVDHNMEIANRMGHFSEKKFWWRYSEGTKESYPSEIWHTDIFPTIQKYISETNFEAVTSVTFQEISEAISPVEKLFTGESMTQACKIRNFIGSHHLYKGGDEISSQIMYDLMDHIRKQQYHR